ncbi:MAG: ABC transporter ATP-binding protein [Nitrospira sp.]|nr:ABC transporter ATP-binding protein [Nitrospira sp.]
MDAIVIDKLSKTHRPAWPWQQAVTTLHEVSLSVGYGEIFGFLGPNGAGKTTTMKIVLGLMRATTGTVELLGRPALDVDVHKSIGYLPESPYFYDYLTAEEFLWFYGRLGQVNPSDLQQRIPTLLAQVGLTEARYRPLRKFSKGMLQRIGLAQALIHDPQLVMLDEPMSGLDPVGRKDVRDIILGLRDQGKTIFFSTHIISDVEMICDRVGILAKGRMVTVGSMDELVNRNVAQSVEVICEGIDGESIPLVKEVAMRVLQRGNRCWMALPGQQRLEEVLAAVRQAGGRLVSIIPHKGSLEEIFLERTSQRT